MSDPKHEAEPKHSERMNDPKWHTQMHARYFMLGSEIAREIALRGAVMSPELGEELLKLIDLVGESESELNRA